jgi:hypothetical protein
VDIPVHIVATEAQADDPKAFFASAQRIVCHELCYRKMTARGPVGMNRLVRQNDLRKSLVRRTVPTGAK